MASQDHFFTNELKGTPFWSALILASDLGPGYIETFVYAAYLLQTIVTLVSFKFETSLLILHLAVVPGLHVVLLLHFNKQLLTK